MGTRDFLANLLCVFIPLFGFELWRNYSVKSHQNQPMARYLMALAILVASILCTLFNFPISSGMNVNLSIVCLSMGFYLLSWAMGLWILALFIISQIVLSIQSFAHGHLTWQVVKTVLNALPHAMIIVCVFALIMSVCSITTQKKSFRVRATGFVLSLICYTLIDFVYVRQETHTPYLKFIPFAAFILVFNFTFVVAVRLIVSMQESATRRLEDVRAEKLELISQLAASVAHEVRNPITVVKGYTQLMQRENYDAVRIQEFLKSMEEELNRANTVLTDYLHLAKDPIDTTDSEVNFSLIVDHSVNVLSPYAVNKNVQLISSSEKDLFIYGNPTRVTQAIINLVKNAIESHDHGGTVKVFLKQNHGTVHLEVKDSGKGIPQSMLHKLGEPYWTTKREGTGLGLTLVYKVINDVKGKVQVHSKEGHGTTFSIQIPSVAKPNLNQNQNGRPNPGASNPILNGTPEPTNQERDSKRGDNNLSNHNRVVWTM